MDEAKLYWTILVALVSAGWVLTAFIRDRASQSVALNSALMSRLMEFDKLNIEYPDIQKFISQNATQEEAYFRNKKLLDEDLFYKAKSLVYKELNLFDEILLISSKASESWFFLRPVMLQEISDWDKYMKEKFRHPLYRSILNHDEEKQIFGASLRNYWARNKQEIESKSADAFIW